MKPKHIEVNGRRGLLGEFRIITLKVISIYSFREITCDDCFFIETDLGHLYTVFLIYFMCLLQGLSSRLLCQVVLNGEVRIKFIPLWSQNGYLIHFNENLDVKMLLRWNFLSLYLLEFRLSILALNLIISTSVILKYNYDLFLDIFLCIN